MAQYPTPYWSEEDSCWKVDLRSARSWGGDFGRPVVDAPRVNTPEACALAHAGAVVKWYELKARAEATSAQLRLDLSGTLTLAAAAAEYLARRRAQERPSPASLKRGTWKYLLSYHRSITRELGHVHVTAFAPPDGKARLEAYRDECAERGTGPKARHNRLNVIGQVLRFCFETRRLVALPELPEATIGDEVLSNAEFRWYTEADFRALRAGLYDNVDRLHGLWRWHRGDRARIADYVGRRKLYLSASFYMGPHTLDLDLLDDMSLRPRHGGEYGSFLRRNHKSARSVPEAVKAMPEQLQLDVIEEINRLGRPWHPREQVAGGVWKTVTRELAKECARLNLPLYTPTIGRHSVAHHLCLLGWPETAAADYLGHVDDRMVRTVYNQVIPEDRWRGKEALPWTNESMRKVRGGTTRRAVIYDFERSRAGTSEVPPARALQSLKAGARAPRNPGISDGGGDQKPTR